MGHAPRAELRGRRGARRRDEPWFPFDAVHGSGGRESRLRCHDVIDERSAAFFALGQARYSNRPTLVLCTSGSAAAQYWPAVVEASAAFIPLLVVTTEPPYRGTGLRLASNFNQVKLFGGYARRLPSIWGCPPTPLSPPSSSTTRCEPGRVLHNVAGAGPGPRERSCAQASRTSRVTDRGGGTPASARPRLTLPHPSSQRPRHECFQTKKQYGQSRGCATRRAALCWCSVRRQLDGPPRARMSSRLPSRPVFRSCAKLQANFDLRLVDRTAYLCAKRSTPFRSQAFRDANPPDLILQLGTTPTSTGWERCISTVFQTPTAS